MPQDLKPRTKAFALRVIRMYSKLPKNNTVAQVLGKQVLRSGTSVGEAIPVPLPPLFEQRRIVAELDTLKRLQAETAAELDALLPAILDKAFKGEL